MDFEAILTNPTTIAIIAYLASTALPAGITSRVQVWLERWPIIGTLTKTVRLVIESLQAKQVDSKVAAASHVAEKLVVGAEQLKNTGKIDGSIAARQVTQALRTQFRIDEDTASKITEGAVLGMKDKAAADRSRGVL